MQQVPKWALGRWKELSELLESQEGGVPDVSKAVKEVPVCFLKDNFLFLNTEHLHLLVIVWILVANWLLCILLFDKDKEKVIIGG